MGLVQPLEARDWLIFMADVPIFFGSHRCCRQNFSGSGGRRIHGECLNGAWSVCREMVV